MHVPEAVVVTVVCLLHTETSIGVPLTGLRGLPNYDKIRQAFPNTSDVDLLNIREKLQSLNAKTKSSIRVNDLLTSAPVVNRNYDTPPEAGLTSIASINAPIADFLFESDLFLNVEQLSELTQDANHREKRKATSDVSRKWPTKAKGVIPYFLDSSLSATQSTQIKIAITWWEDNTCLKFQQNATGANYIMFVNHGSGCYSDSIGMKGGYQEVSIGDGCEWFGLVTHEIGHALGFWHEQSRYDRDSFVKIGWTNIPSSKKSNFGKRTPAEMNLYNVTYDYGSVMHYGSEDFAISRQVPVLIAADERFQSTMGQRRAPSFLDVLTMNRHYECTALCASRTIVCKNGGYPDPNNCNKCKCSASFGGTLCDRLAPSENAACGGAVHVAKKVWQTFSGAVSVAANTYNPTTCFWHIKSPSDTVIELSLNITESNCVPDCLYNSVDIQLDSDFTKAAIRHCCQARIPLSPYLSTTNVVPIIASGFYSTSFSIRYKYVVPSTLPTSTKKSPTTVTTLATQSCQQSANTHIWSTRINACIGPCNSSAFVVTKNSAHARLGESKVDDQQLDSCYFTFTASTGMRIQFNVTGFYNSSVCNTGCTDTSLVIRDGLKPVQSPLCCASDVPKSYTTGDLLYLEVNFRKTFSWSVSFRAISTSSCSAGQIWSDHSKTCIGPCVPYSWIATAAGKSAPAGTKIQVNTSSIFGVFNTDCTATSLVFRDRLKPSQNRICNSTDLPKSYTMDNLVYIESHRTTAISWITLFRYIGTPVVTTTPTINLAPCPTGQLRNPRSNGCINSCGPNWSRSATSTWQYDSLEFSGKFPSGCYYSIVAPKGKTVEVSFSITYSICEEGCATTGLSFSDNFLPPSSWYCCRSGLNEEYTTTSSKALMIVQTTGAGIAIEFSYRYIGIPSAS